MLEFTEVELKEIRDALNNWEMEEGMYDWSPNLAVIRSVREKLGFTEDVVKMYDPKFGDDKVCVCGHTYYRHFDTHHQMYAIGCKYCHCDQFQDKETAKEGRDFNI